MARRVFLLLAKRAVVADRRAPSPCTSYGYCSKTPAESVPASSTAGLASSSTSGPIDLTTEDNKSDAVDGQTNEAPCNDSKESQPCDDIPPPPDNCCATNCINCVWLDYADQLMKHYQAKGLESALKTIEKEVENPGVRYYIMMELKMKYKSGA